MLIPVQLCDVCFGTLHQKSESTIQMSIKIMNTFVKMRRFLADNAGVLERINEIDNRQRVFQKHTEDNFDKIFNYIAKNEETVQKIFFDGQVYDAFSLLVSLVVRADKRIVLVDNYVEIGTLNILAKKKAGVEAIVYTVRKTKLSEIDVRNFNLQYPTLQVRYTGVFHDRFLIVDDTYAYHIGASVKDAGKKCFGINLIEDTKIVKDILDRLYLETENADNL